jgi:hypothetical protein
VPSEPSPYFPAGGSTRYAALLLAYLLIFGLTKHLLFGDDN